MRDQKIKRFLSIQDGTIETGVVLYHPKAVFEQNNYKKETKLIKDIDISCERVHI
jgi:hypothetical protein